MREIAEVASYTQALATWRRADDINAWIGARFRYDPVRAMQLSETQREKGVRVSIYEPAAFFSAPTGVCVDLARFAVETLRAIAPDTQPMYLMIEFDPVALAGNVLRRHWVAVFRRDGAIYVLGDSKRPGHLAGPYADIREFIAAYARYRGRTIVSFAERASFARTQRAMATRRVREPAAP